MGERDLITFITLVVLITGLILQSNGCDSHGSRVERQLNEIRAMQPCAQQVKQP